MNTQTLKPKANIQDDGLMQRIADLPKTVPSYPKDIIKEMEAEVPKLTQLEKDVLINGITGSGFYDYEGTYIWSDCLVDTCKITTKAQIGDVVASLVKKGLVEEAATRDTSEASIRFTPQGLRALEQIECPLEKAPKNPQDIVRMNAIGSCLSAIHDVRFRFDLTDKERDVILGDTSKELGAIYDNLKQSLEG